MKRGVITCPIIKRINSLLFWHECEFCGHEFKREEGFKIKDYKRCYGTGENPIRTYYCCSDCAKDKGGVLKLIKQADESFINNKPELPGARMRRKRRA